MQKLLSLLVSLAAIAGCDAAASPPCDRASECTAGSVCLGGHCTAATGCTSSRMCPGLVCHPSAHVCVECTTDLDCADGRVCVSQVCGAPPAACASDRDCSADGLVCDVAGGTCVECVAPEDCAPGEACVDHRCELGDGDAGLPIDGGAPTDAGGLDGGRDGGPPIGLDAGSGLDAPAGGPTHARIHLTWRISDTFGTLTCFDVGIAEVMANVTPTVGMASTHRFRCGDGAGDITGLAFGSTFVSTQGNDSSGSFLVSGSIDSLDLEASPCDAVVGDECVRNLLVEFRY